MVWVAPFDQSGITLRGDSGNSRVFLRSVTTTLAVFCGTRSPFWDICNLSFKFVKVERVLRLANLPGEPE